MLFMKQCLKLGNCFKIGTVPKKYSIIASVLETPKIGDKTEVKGWVKSLRVQKEFIFADVNDGSCSKKLQIVIPKNLKIDDNLTYGSSVHITGKLSKSPRGQLELVADSVDVLGECVVLDGYPFNPRTVHPPEYIRQFLHLRSRTNYIAALLRVRHSVTNHIHNFLTKQKYIHIHTPILTSNDCEGAGEVFKVQPDNVETIKAMMQEGKNTDSVYFGTKTYLTVSGQLHLEAICRGMGNVYTLGPTFRAENSRSRLHLSEFYMLEAEIAFCDTIEKLQRVIEGLLKYVFIETRNTNEADLFLIDKNNKTPDWLNKHFITLPYDEARNILNAKGLDVTEEGINKEQELSLVDHCQAPVFIVQWPKNLKSFYMKESPLDNNKPIGISRNDGKRPDGLTLVPWERGRALLWDATCSDTLAPSHVRETAVKVGAAAEKAEAAKWYKYSALVQNYIFVPFAVETLGPWSSSAKKFLKELNNNMIVEKVDALDLLAPVTGEIVGGSLREDDYEKLKTKLPSDALNWYLELRKFGNIPTGGFGLGLERILQVLCNIPNIKDTLPFPRWPHNCDM